MNFLIDANLPRRLVHLFRERGHHAVHTLDLPDGNATEDAAILQYSDENDCVITTKDSDFTTSFWLNILKAGTNCAFTQTGFSGLKSCLST